MTMERGKVYGIIGNNGAGKSTMLRVLSGVMSPNSGTVERNYQKINLLALGAGFSRELSGRDNIYLNAMLLGFSKKDISEVFDDIVAYSEIGDFINRPIKTYSSGMVSRLGFSIAIHLKPEVLLIDEVLSVGDAQFREKSFNSIRKIIEDKDTTVAIVSHSMNQIEVLCDRVIWLDKGRVVAQGDTADVLELYNQQRCGDVSVDEIIAMNVDEVEVDGNTLTAALDDYTLRLADPRRKTFLGKPWDHIRDYQVGEATVTLTKRRLPNKDQIFYFEVDSPGDMEIVIQMDNVREVRRYDKLYRKPEYDNRYGENRVTGFDAYLDLEQGSALAGKVYYYNPLTKSYPDGGVSFLYELVEESGGLSYGNDCLSLTLKRKAGKASFFLLLSRDKLFRDPENLDTYMDYYYKGLYNNNVWCSFFMQPSGTYTKLPYSIEPFTKEGYGYSLHHSSRKDVFPYYLQTNERFFDDLLSNAVLQAYLYQNNDSGVFHTPYTSTWLQKETGITAPFIDTRLNETFSRSLLDFQAVGDHFSELDPMRNYVDFLYRHYEGGGQVYRAGEGVFFPDYFKDGLEKPSHASLNHQLGIAMIFAKAYQQYGNGKYLDVFSAMLRFIEATGDSWINPESRDLFYSVNYNADGSFSYSGTDYVYVTLIDLLYLQKTCLELERIGRNACADRLITQKVAFLKATDYDIFSDSEKVPPGEKVDSRSSAKKMYSQLFSKNGEPV